MPMLLLRAINRITLYTLIGIVCGSWPSAATGSPVERKCLEGTLALT
jgi:hypothetical protein